MASLLTFISISAKMRRNLEQFCLLFGKDIGINKVTINSKHCSPRVLHGQILIYKIV